MGGQCTESPRESLWRGQRFAMFAVKNTETLVIETYKLSSDAGHTFSCF